ncbi:hypothetical protein XU06_29420 (plasmid) [Rhodococcus erythropolis]|uniref:2-oxo acid dehydrogenase subunit E2 n=1 Tax=Rhodococcus erythropolis TaxID=1833 RepID=UPI00061B6317|nr:2-oxo acid dehydrogenase subunit E2 [Rhodococcus erythropolis]AKE01099.1 hypothetical protein XU06_29420 [Rhodococcus erythropolis]
MTGTETVWPDGERRERLRPIQQITAERLQMGWASIVPATLMTEVDASALLEFRSRLAASGQRVGMTALIAQILAGVLARHPGVNCRLDGEELVSWSSVNLGLAISVGGRDLVVGVVHQADTCDVAEISSRIADLQQRAEARKLRPRDTSGAVVTLSSVGMMIDDVVGTPVVPPGQTAVVLVSGATDKVVVRDGEAVIRPMMPISITVDHRIVNGAAMSAFLKDLCTTLGSANPKGTTA